MNSKNSKLIFLNLIVFIAIFLKPTEIFRFVMFLENGRNYQVKNRNLKTPYSDRKKFFQSLNNDYDKLITEYRSFVGWNRKKFKSKYINIEG